MIQLLMKRACLPLLVSLQLVACGGGGGGGGAAPTEPTGSTESVTYSGVASKGILANAKVALFEVTGSGVSSQPIATGITDENGQFSVELARAVSSIYVEISRLDDNSWMYCDLVDCGASTHEVWDTNGNHRSDYGERVALSNTFTLGAYAHDPQSGKKINVNLLTHLAAEAFAEPPTEEQLQNTYQEMQSFLGLSVSPDQLPPFSDQLVEGAGEDLVDVLMALSILPPASGRIDDVADAISRLSSSMRDHGGLSGMPDLSVTLTALNAANLLRQVDDSQLGLIDELQQRSDTAAESENLVPSRDRPKLPPLI